MRKKMMFAASALVLLASCSNDDNTVVSSKLPNELGVSVNVKSVTRSEVSSFVDNSTVGVFIDGLNAGTYTSKKAVYSCLNSAWSGPTLDADKIFLTGNEANVYGYYPATATVDLSAKAMTCAIPASQSFTATEADDYMYSTNDKGALPVVSSKTADATKASLYFHHALSKISFVVAKSEYYPAGVKSGVVTKIELNGTDKFVTAGTVDLTTGAFTKDATTVSTLTLNGTANAYEFADSASDPKTVLATAYGLFAPCADLTNINISFTIDGTVMTKASAFNSVSKWESGNNYIYTVTVKPKELEITCQIVPWAVTTQDLGTIGGDE